jgi:hypothetical protein
MAYEFDTNNTISPLIDIARGYYREMRPINLFGFNRVIGTEFESIFNDGGGAYPFLASASVLSCVSSSAIDTTGLYIEGLDANYNPISETVTLSGTTPVSTTQQFFRINKARMATTTNVGNVSVKVSTDTLAYIEAGAGSHQAIVYTVPADSKLFVASVSFASGTVNPNKYITGIARTVKSGLVQRFWQSTWSVGFLQFDIKVPFVIPEKTDFEFQVKSSSGENEIDCYLAGFLETDGWLVDQINRVWE